MGSGHSHAAEPAEVPLSRAARPVLIGALVAIGVATLAALIVLWPETPETGADQFAAPGVTFPSGTVTKVQPACPGLEPGTGINDPGMGIPGAVPNEGSGAGCGQIGVRVDGGAGEVSVPIAPEVSRSGLAAGDRVELLRTPGYQGAEPTFALFNVERTTPLAWLAVIFVISVFVVARVRGALALVGVAFGAFILVQFMLPALLNGANGMLIALVGSTAIMYVVLYLAHGVSMRTSVALGGTLIGVAVTTLIGTFAVGQARLTGISDDSGAMLSSFLSGANFQGLLTCALIIAALGVLNDVTITQASSVWELRAVAPEMSRWAIYKRGMRIGRDHIASTIYTIVFAYAGAALSVLLLLYFYDRPVLELLSAEQIAEEVVRTLASAIGLVWSVPVTTGLAALCVAGPRRADGDRVAGAHAAV